MKLSVISWQSYYNIFYKVSKKIKEFEVRVYSARVLEKDSLLLERALKDLESSTVVLLYRSTQESFWELIEKKIKAGELKTKILSLGTDPSFLSLSNVNPEILGQAQEYILRNGEENIRNLYYFLANRLGGLEFPYQEPIKIPWEGLYHPKAERVFTDLKDYLQWYELREAPTVGLIFARHFWVTGNLEVEDTLISLLEERGFNVIPIFVYSVRDKNLGTKGTGEIIREWLINQKLDFIIKLTPFFIESSREKDLSQRQVAESGIELLKRLNVPVACPVNLYYKTVEEWEREEVNLDIAWAIALPEFEGVIEPIVISAQREAEGETRERTFIAERIKKFVARVEGWIRLRKTPPKERKVAFILHNNPCASVEATVGSAAHLDSLESVVRIMKRMKKEGYLIENIPESGKELIQEIMNRKAISEFRWTSVREIVEKGGYLDLLPKEEYLEWFSELPEITRKRMIEAWGNPPGEHKEGIPPAMLYEGKIVITGLRFGNVVVCVQPKRGCAGARCDGQVCKILHEPDVPPPHQYVATYKWLARKFKANAIIHVGTHGNLEFLPGKGVALSGACFPDINIDFLPHLYIYNADNPPEGTIAKRRSCAVLIDHLQTVMTESGLYGELENLDKLLQEYEEVKFKDPSKRKVLEELIIDSLKKSNLAEGIKIQIGRDKKAISQLAHEETHKFFEEIARALHSHLALIRNSLTPEGMHIFGELPQGEKLVNFIYAIMKYDTGERVNLRREIAKLLGYDLNSLLADRAKVDEKTKKSYGALLEEIDHLGKTIIFKILQEEGICS